MCCVLAAEGCTVEQAALRLNASVLSAALVRTLWRRLESEGREEAFWRAIGAAAATLRRENVDYSHRRSAMRLPSVIDATHAVAPETSRGHIKVWLVDQWACSATRNPRKSVLDGTIDELATAKGPALEEAANQAMRLCA